MPIYEYKCLDCGKSFEVIRSIKEADLPLNCKSCQSVSTQRKISVFFAQSGSKVIAGNNSGGCSSCSGGSCSSCRSN